MSELSKRLRQSAENQVTVSGGVVKLHYNIYAMAADELEQNEGLIERQGSEIALLMKDNEVQDIEISRLRATERAAVSLADTFDAKLMKLEAELADEKILREVQEAALNQCRERRELLEAQAAEMRTALRELSGQIIQGRVGFGLAVCPSLDPILAQTELALSTDAGRKVLDVVRAADRLKYAWPNGEREAEYLDEALSALGWKP